MGHVPPQRWADALAGRLSDARVDKIQAHAEECSRCAAARDQVAAARSACADIASTKAPDLHWDHIGARIYWATSSERRAADRRDGKWRWAPRLAVVGGLAAVALATVALVLNLRGGDGEAVVVAPEPAPATAPAPVVAAASLPVTPLTGVVVFAKGDVTVDGLPLQFDEVIATDASLATGNGSLAVQFAADSGFKLAPESSLHLRSFDERRVELVVEGTVVVEVARRSDDQYFAVVAGGRSVTVRGTAFRVEHRAGDLDVACLHGRVDVSDGDARVAVAAGQRIHFDGADLVGAQRARELRSDEVVALEHSIAVPLLPAWPQADALFATSAVLRLAGREDTPVEVDGVARGSGSFMMRVMSGRHRVDRGGRGSWVELAAGDRVEVARRDPGAERKLRSGQLRHLLDEDTRARRCLRPLVKQGLVAGSYITLEVGVGSSGRIRHLNIRKTNLPGDVARCVRDRVDQVTLPPGPETTVRYRLRF